MKTILKEGVPYRTEYKVTCMRCKCEFTYQFEDVVSDRDGDFVTCPYCGAFICHNPNNIVKKNETDTNKA